MGEDPQRFTIRLTDRAAEMLGDLPKAAQRLIADKIDKLEQSPQGQGKPLKGELAGLWSVRAGPAGRYRVLYSIDISEHVVIIEAVGIRREGARSDVYALAYRLKKRGEL